MSLFKIFTTAGCALILMTSAVRAETKVELQGTHLCCGGCAKAVDAIIKKIDGVSNKNDTATGNIALTAKDDATAQKALDALATGGFHGKTDSKTLVQKDDSGVTSGKVKSLTLVDVHNCCGSCNRSIVKAIEKVPGVTGNTAKPKAESFEVTGDFDGAEVVKALFDAGFHVRVKK